MNGGLNFGFKKYLVKYIHSIDPNFQVNDIEQALYVSSDIEVESASAIIKTRSKETSDEIKKLLDHRNVSDMFSGM